MLAMEGHEFGDDVVPLLEARVAEHLSAGHDLVGDAAEAQADLDACVPWVLALALPGVGQGVEVLVALDEVVGGAQDGGAELAVAAADEGPSALSTSSLW